MNGSRQIFGSIGVKSSKERKMFRTSSPIICIGTVRTKRKKAQITMRDNTWVGFLGRALTEAELGEIDQIVDDCRKLSRTELAATVCELFSWRRPSGRLKTVECRQLLEYLDSEGLIELPGRGRRNLNTLLDLVFFLLILVGPWLVDDACRRSISFIISSDPRSLSENSAQLLKFPLWRL